MEAGHLQRSTNDRPKTHPRHGIMRQEGHPLARGRPSAYIYRTGQPRVGFQTDSAAGLSSLKGTQNKTP